MAEETKFHDSGVMEVSTGLVPVDSSSVNDLDCRPRQPEQPGTQGVGPDGVGKEFDNKFTDVYTNLDNVYNHSYHLARSPERPASTNPVYMGGLPSTARNEKKKKACRSCVLQSLLVVLFASNVVGLGLAIFNLANTLSIGSITGAQELSIKLEQQSVELDQLRVKLDQQRAELDQLNQQRAELDQQRVELDQQRAELDQQRIELDQQRAELDQQQIELHQLRLQWQNFTDQEAPTALSGCTTIRRRGFGCYFVNTTNIGMLAICISPTTELSPLEFTCAVSVGQMMAYGTTPVPLDGRWMCECFLIYSPHAFQNVTVPFTCDLYERHCS